MPEKDLRQNKKQNASYEFRAGQANIAAQAMRRMISDGTLAPSPLATPKASASEVPIIKMSSSMLLQILAAWPAKLSAHLALSGILSLFVGLMLFFIAAMNNPFRGEESVSSDAYKLVR